MDYSPWGRKELDMTEQLSFTCSESSLNKCILSLHAYAFKFAKSSEKLVWETIVELLFQVFSIKTQEGTENAVWCK